MKKTAIAIMSFNRPHYLKPVLESIKAQTIYSDFDYYIFQDGAVNKFTNIRYASDQEIQECIRLEKSILPNAEVRAHPNNVGVYLNFDRAEKYLFTKKDYERIYFFEDDLILNTYYFDMLTRMMDKFEPYNVGEVNVCGVFSANLKKQIANQNKIMPAGHHWGYGLSKDKWLIRQQYLSEYAKIMQNIDYRQRPSDKIVKLFKSLGSRIKASSQDGAKDVAYMLAGLARLTTYTVHANYIGRNGLHLNEKKYLEMGFDKIELFHNYQIQFDDNNIQKAIDQSLTRFKIN